ncbi:hypothetical protein BU23DRAFT_627611 [Bimuria novae-zelandiae CBS 107.79]|uniref:Uncharacterized protein n=1 Tax=Bimuria novae-zelandiae CBS 107.79 TaxID=1447943 RepID=A0A6A5UJJ5_9PLEO|nr:hypothetical protein BU23DRAFT_627611 [Bimuria novae-zelandiae CBS 107.79]
MPRSLQNPPRHDQSIFRIYNYDPSNGLNLKEPIHPLFEENIGQYDQNEDQIWNHPGLGIQRNFETPDEPQHLVQQSIGVETQDRFEEEIEAVKDSARERYETFHARMVEWNNFAKGLNCSMQRAYGFLSLGEYEKAEKVFERVIRTTDEFLRDNSSRSSTS